MSSQPDRLLRIEVLVKASQPELLEGLEVWLHLGLLNHAQVRRLSRTYLTCFLPEPVVTATKPVPDVGEFFADEVDVPPVRTLTPSPLSQMWFSLRDELSVRWLLFLGVFLVVVSSGVLAATQWRNFPAAGQYGVLWAYTVIFWVGSFWAGKQRNLQLTAQTLRLITLLLVPVNFWAMDSFRLWRHPGEWIVVAIAAITLTTITLLHQEIRDNSSRLASSSTLLLWLSYLHWGWHWSAFPFVAVYLGMVGTALVLPKRFGLSQSLTPQVTSADAPAIDIQPSIGNSIIIYALTVLLGRAIFVIQLPVAQLGLAIGICGWLFVRLGQSPQATSQPASFQSKIWEGIGGSLLVIGWLVSVGETVPWQATIVSGLGLWFFANRLQRYWLRRDLVAIFVIGLQAHWLVWQLLPLGWQQGIVAFFTQLTNSRTNPEALLSLGLFPYAIAMVMLTDWIYRAHHAKLARFGEQLTFCLGLVLTLGSLASPSLRSLNLLLSTITLAAVTVRWTPTRKGLVYLTHITGLLTLTSAIDWLFPNLSQPAWAGILLVVMVVEWSYSTLPHSLLPTLHSPIWQRSAWHLGFALSGLSYVLLFDYAYPSGTIFTSVTQKYGLLWLLTPLALTGVASVTGEPRRTQAAWFSVAALATLQFLTLPLPETRLVCLGIATGLMWVNTRYLKQLAAAVTNVGFGLIFVWMLLWDGVPELMRFSTNWFLVVAIAILVLWLLRTLLQHRPGTLAALYAQAFDNWAIGLCCIELVMLTLQCLVTYAKFISFDWQYLAASVLIGIALVYRCWQQPKNIGVYSLSWAVELIFAEGILLAGGSALELATVTIILGLTTLFVADIWSIKYRRPIPLTSIEILPLLYALLAIVLRLNYFTSWTGLLTLGAALTGIGVGRRRVEWKPLTYLSLAGISVAWYELVIYQMLQATGGSPADGFTILASVATAIAIFYRVLAWFWQSRTSQPLLSLSVAEIKSTAHIHWAIGSLLMVLAAQNATETRPNLTAIGVTVSLILAIYALLQGRCQEVIENAQQQRQRTASPASPASSASLADSWVYFGLTELAATGIYARLMWTQLGVFDAWRAIIACVVAYGMYQLPWHQWGWRRTPWQRSALVFPALVVLGTMQAVSDVSLLVVAGFYAWIAQRRSNLRFTYLSVAFVDWAIARWLDHLHFTDALWYTTLIGLSLLYVAQFDAHLKHPEQRQIRHYLRLVGSGAICLVALFYHQDTGHIPGLIPGIISIIAIFAGLILRVRAFLFVGTATFLLTAFYQLVILISRYPFIKWVVGLIAGIIFIGMAANFENRREQITSVFRNSRNELGAWE